MHIVRYADDVRIFCRYKREAEKVKYAVTSWLKDRLHLQTSAEKTRVVNAKRKYSEFLGFKIKVISKSGKRVTRSHICNKKLKAITNQLCEQVKKIAKAPNANESLAAIWRFNSMVMGHHNYFCIATHVSLDCAKIAYKVNRVLVNKLGIAKDNGRLSKNKSDGRKLTNFERDKYGQSKMLRFDKATKNPIYPIAYVRTKHPMNIKYGQTPYTPQGRELMHKSLELDLELLHMLMRTKVYGSVEYADNRLSLFCAQYGKDAITGIPFNTTDEIHCHHKLPKKLGGTDAYSNLILLHVKTHKLIHASTEETIRECMDYLQLDKKALAKINRLRKLVQLSIIKP